ncbi:MAG: hypothetical protein ACO3YZ_03520 [Candidatus Nanopelagicaceae bacterium]
MNHYGKYELGLDLNSGITEFGYYEEVHIPEKLGYSKVEWEGIEYGDQVDLINNYAKYWAKCKIDGIKPDNPPGLNPSHAFAHLMD